MLYIFNIFGEDIDKPAEKFDSAGKFKCFSTYELVEVLKYDIHYDEVRFKKIYNYNREHRNILLYLLNPRTATDMDVTLHTDF